MTLAVTIDIYPGLSLALGVRHKVRLTEQLRPQDTLQTVLARLAVTHDGVGAMIYDIPHATLYDGVVIFVNDRPIANELIVPLHAGDCVAVTPFYAGG